MGLFNRIASFLDDWHTSSAASPVANNPTTNPATGLPMTGGVDIAGNSFGIDLSSHARKIRAHMVCWPAVTPAQGSAACQKRCRGHQTDQ